MDCTDFYGYWKIKSIDDGVLITNEVRWTDQSLSTELAYVSGMAIEGAFYDPSEKAMIFLLSCKRKVDGKKKPYCRLMKVQADGEGNHSIHSLSLSADDFYNLLRMIRADQEIENDQ